MKHLPVILGLVLTGLCFADDAAFQEHKEKMLQNVEERLSKINEHKTCLTNATTDEALQACTDSLRAWHEEKQTEHLVKRKERIEKRLQKRKRNKN